MCVLSSFPLNHHQKQMCSHNITKSKKRTLKICCQVLNTLSFNKLRLKKQETLTTEGDWWQKYELRKSQESLLCLDSVRPLAPGWLEQRWGGYTTTWPQRQSVSLGLMWGEPVSARTHFPSCGHISKCSVSMALQIYYLCWKEDGLIEKKKIWESLSGQVWPLVDKEWFTRWGTWSNSFHTWWSLGQGATKVFMFYQCLAPYTNLNLPNNNSIVLK